MILVVGGGPAGFFGAIHARTANPDTPVILLERQGQVLRKVAVSGGGRCNVTHSCFDPRDLAGFYPRGGRALIGPFSRWNPTHTVDWFQNHGVALKTESDGRIFPVSDKSSTIIDCLCREAASLGVEVRTGEPVTALQVRNGRPGFQATLASGRILGCDQVLLAIGGRTSAGGGAGGYDLAADLGHTIVPPVPSLFSFHTRHPLLDGLAGVAIPDVGLTALSGTLPRKGLQRRGPLLVTHKGVSGPGVIQLSALGARAFYETGYEFQLKVNWVPELGPEALEARLKEFAAAEARKQVATRCPLDLPRRLWDALVRTAGVAPETRWADLGRKPRRALLDGLGGTLLHITGQATNKEEFVTCGGVKLGEVDLKTMESKLCPGLFLAGEVLDIDGLTGGFNFQACWTTGKLAGDSLGGL